jgi:hypothetical protein
VRRFALALAATLGLALGAAAALAGPYGNYPISDSVALGGTPTISSGFGGSPSVTASRGTVSFRINVGTGGAASSGVIGLPAAPVGWTCFCFDQTTESTTVTQCKQTANTTTTATIGNFTDIAGSAAWVASDIVYVSCFPF